jgi:hypothetical protein
MIDFYDFGKLGRNSGGAPISKAGEGEFLPEEVAKVGRLGKAEIISHFGNGQIGIAQQLFGFQQQAFADQIIGCTP